MTISIIIIIIIILTHQLFLDGQDAGSGRFTGRFLAGDDDHLRVAVLGRQVDFGVCFLTDLQETPVSLETHFICRRRKLSVSMVSSPS